MPSLTSHGLGHYYAHASNAFWWIAGDVLGFRRGGPAEDRAWPDQFQTKPSKSILSVVSGSGPVLNYEEQVAAINMVLSLLQQQSGELTSVSMTKVNFTLSKDPFHISTY